MLCWTISLIPSNNVAFNRGRLRMRASPRSLQRRRGLQGRLGQSLCGSDCPQIRRRRDVKAQNPRRTLPVALQLVQLHSWTHLQQAQLGVQIGIGRQMKLPPGRPMGIQMHNKTWLDRSIKDGGTRLKPLPRKGDGRPLLKHIWRLRAHS